MRLAYENETSGLRLAVKVHAQFPLAGLRLGALLSLRKRTGEERRHLREEHRYALLILLVLWILVRRDPFRKRRGSLEDQHISNQTDARPVVIGIALPAAPLVQRNPDGLLGRKVGVA